MQLDAYLKQQVVAIGTPEERASSRKNLLSLGASLVLGAALVVASYALSEQRYPRGGVRPLAGLSMLGTVCLLIAFVGFGVRLSRGGRSRRALIKKYGLRGDGRDPFSAETYVKAAAALRGFRPMSYEVAEENFGADAVAVLVLTGCIEIKPRTRLWEKVVSIRSIEEDRPADERDDAES
ncbi:MAG TPA: hypothetical protein VLC10_02975 [Patescibacteria group bacterium]|nr:hypothetical protein [Patescibacteria group bacterium]